MSLNKRETDFCRFFVACRNSREAAAKAGFAFPERSGIRLLDKQAVIDEIDRLSEQVRTAVSAVDGLKRIAFGSVADAVKLVKSLEYGNSHFVIVGTSFYTGISQKLLKLAKQRKATVIVIDENAAERVPVICQNLKRMNSVEK